jgi:LysR family hydrogen peroxide-inducible transcriptional activator
MRPTLRQLEYLVAVAEELHFGHAAEREHVSQPGLSVQIKQLEQTLGAALFERDRRHVLATPAGREAAQRARLILAAVDDLAAAVQQVSNPLAGTLRLGVIPTVAPYLLPRILPLVRTRYPELRLLLREAPTHVLVSELGEGELDLVLLALEADLGDTEVEPLFEDPFLLVVGQSHPFATRKRATMGDLDELEVLLLEDGH